MLNWVSGEPIAPIMKVEDTLRRRYSKHSFRVVLAEKGNTDVSFYQSHIIFWKHLRRHESIKASQGTWCPK